MGLESNPRLSDTKQIHSSTPYFSETIFGVKNAQRSDFSIENAHN
jgi:hypothetical protein